MSYSSLILDPWLKVEPLLDDYAKFWWDDEPMVNYHAFIINEQKGSLKFYNGPSFSNSYTKPQFETASSKLTGVTFNTQQISFTIAVYAVTEELYRKLIYKLHPYTIGNLIFNFQPKWRYIVKLAKITDGTRLYIGTTSDKQDLYYSELTLTFEVQGDSVALSTEEISYTFESSDIIKFTNGETSDLNTPFKLVFQPINNLEPMSLEVYNTITNTSIGLFNLTLKNIPLNADNIFLEYNSQTGDVCWINGDKKEVIAYLTTYTSGKRMLAALINRAYMLPGTFENDINWADIRFKINNINIDTTKGCGISCYKRTNLI